MRSFLKIIPTFLFVIALSASLQAANNNKNIGIGVQYSWVYQYVNGPGVTVKIGNFPVIGANVNIDSQGLGVGLTVDWHAWNPPLGPFLFYIGPGIGGNIFVGSSFAFNLGLRVPIGLQWFPAKWLEIFLEVPPTIGLSLGANSRSGYLAIPVFGVGVAVGIRFYLF